MEKYLKKLNNYENKKKSLLNDLDKIITSMGLSLLKLDEESLTIFLVILFYLILRIKDLGVRKYYLNILKDNLIDKTKNLTK